MELHLEGALGRHPLVLALALADGKDEALSGLPDRKPGLGGLAGAVAERNAVVFVEREFAVRRRPDLDDHFVVPAPVDVLFLRPGRNDRAGLHIQSSAPHRRGRDFAAARTLHRFAGAPVVPYPFGNVHLVYERRNEHHVAEHVRSLGFVVFFPVRIDERQRAHDRPACFGGMGGRRVDVREKAVAQFYVFALHVEMFLGIDPRKIPIVPVVLLRPRRQHRKVDRG